MHANSDIKLQVRRGEVRLLLGTDAASEGLNLQRLGTLIKSGVPILQALETVAKTSGNKVIEIAIMTARESVKEGERIATQLRKSNVFPPMVIQMVAIGEETGNLDTMLNKIADFYDQEVEVAVKSLTSMIEPIIIVVMGLVIGFIVIAMFLPMFELGNLASRQG